MLILTTKHIKIKNPFLNLNNKTMYLKAFKDIISSMHDNRFLHFQLLSSLDNPEFVKAMKKKKPAFNVKQSQNRHFEMIGMQEYAQHLVEMNYIYPLQELKQKIEDYKNGVFVDNYGKKIDEDYADDEDHRLCQKDFWEYLIWTFAAEDDKFKVSKTADVPKIVFEMWVKGNQISTVMTEGMIKFFNPTILIPDTDNKHREMTQKEKDNHGLDKSLESMEKEFDIMSYRDFCEQALKIAHEKGDIDLIYNAI